MQGNLVHYAGVLGVLLLTLAVLPTMAGTGAGSAREEPPPLPPETRQVLADAVEANLKKHILEKWFPAALDKEQGGFYQNFASDWKRLPRNDKSIVYQARLTWVAAQASLHYSNHPDQAAHYREYARHGLRFLAGTLWDREQGGFYWSKDEAGKAGKAGQEEFERNGEKHAYGIAFGIYAASAAYQATGDPQALDLAKRAFAWLEQHAHDSKNGGYYEALTREGKPILTPADPAATSDFIGTRYGYKSMNTHIHLLEAFTALYEVWEEPQVKKRLEEVFLLVRDKVAVAPGCLHLYFNPDWSPVPDHDSFGHDVETAFLLVESAAALAKQNDSRTWTVARQLVDHALEFGWDSEHSGFYDAGTALGGPTTTTKVWWTQAEGLNALLLLHERYGKETPGYGQAFVKLWDFIQRHQVDPIYGGWHPYLTREGEPENRPKSDRWTEAYHQARALIRVAHRLRQIP